MANLNFQPNTPSTTVQNTPAQNNTVPVRRCTVEDMKQKISTFSSPEAITIKTKLDWFSNISESHKKDLEILLWKYDYIDANSDTPTLLMFLSSLEKLNSDFNKRRLEIQNDSIHAREETIANKFLKDADFPGFDHISDKVNEAATLSFVELLDKASDIKIESINIKPEDWDKLLDDFENGISDSSDLREFKIFRSEFKNTVLYKGDTVWWSVSKSGDLTTKALDFVWMNELVGESLDIEWIWEYLDDILLVLWDDKKFKEVYWEGPIDIAMPWLNIWFTTKEAAALYIYKMKLIFSEMSESESSYVVWFLMYVAYITGMVIWGVIAYKVVSEPFKSLGRRFIDIVSVNSGDKAPKNSLISRENPAIKWEKWIFNKIMYMLHSARHWIYNIQKAWFEAHQDPFAWDLKITIFDWLDSAESSNKMEDTKTKLRVIDFFEKKYKHNPEKIAQMKELWQLKHFLWMVAHGWELSVKSATFWIKLHEITEGTSTKWKILNVFKSAETFKQHILNNVVNPALKSWIESMKTLYENVPTTQESVRIEDLKESTFHKNISANIDLANFWDTELEKEKLFTELKSGIHNAELQYAWDELKIEIARIIDGYLPKFKIQELIWIAITTEWNQTIKSNLQNFLEKVEKWEWIWTKAELETSISRVMSWELESVISEYKSMWEKWLSYTADEIKKIEKKWGELLKHKFNVESVTRPAEFIKLYDLEVDMQRMLWNLDSVESIQEELKKLHNTMISTDSSIKNDYTKWQLNFLSWRIINQGITFEMAISQMELLTEAQLTRLEVDINNKENLSKNTRDKLISEMKDKLVEIKSETEVLEKDRLLEDFKKRYISVIDWDTELKKFMSAIWKEFREVNSEFQKLGASLDIWLREYAQIENSRVLGTADTLLKSAVSMDVDKKTEITQLRDKLALSEWKVSLVQIENSLREILAGKLDSSMIERDSFRFDRYTEEVHLSDEAKELRIVEPKWLDVYNSDTGTRERIEITFTEDSKLEGFIRDYNTFHEKFDKITELRDTKIEISIKEAELSVLNSDIKSEGSVIQHGSKKWNIEELKEQRGELIKKLELLNKKLSNISLANAMKASSVDVLNKHLDSMENDMQRKINQNPWFKNYNAKAWIDVKVEWAKSTMEKFKAEFGRTVIRKL